jgi:hypothetical protein
VGRADVAPREDDRAVAGGAVGAHRARARRRDARRDGVHRANRRTRAVEKFVDF